MAMPRVVMMVWILLSLTSARSEAHEPGEDGLSTMVHLAGAFEPCTGAVGAPQLTCGVVVDDLETGLFARLTGSSGCTAGLRMNGGVSNFVVRFEILDTAKLRFSGTLPTCAQPVTDAPECDFGPAPFLGFGCMQHDLEKCGTCVRLLEAFCYANLTESRVDLRIDNVNQCQDNPEIGLSYMIGVKGKDPQTVGRQEYCRLYLVDPTVIQETNCPAGCG